VVYPAGTAEADIDPAALARIGDHCWEHVENAGRERTARPGRPERPVEQPLAVSDASQAAYDGGQDGDAQTATGAVLDGG